jgi:hypothetical protein
MFARLRWSKDLACKAIFVAPQNISRPIAPRTSLSPPVQGDPFLGIDLRTISSLKLNRRGNSAR